MSLQDRAAPRTQPAGLPLAAHAQRWPFDYTAEERRDLGAMLEPHYLDPDGRLYEWMRPFFTHASRPDTKELLMSLAEAIKSGFEVRSAQRGGDANAG